jgi:YebC/PmpR family DNA-binding regulatory protein
MSGHSKWSTIKRKKGVADAKRGKIFTQLIREISMAAKLGGGDPDANPRLRFAIDKARGQNMPKDNVERAIKRGTGELEGESYEEIRYEGYGPGGAALIVETLTDNRNRTVGEVRHVFTKYGGNLGSTGCVAYLFDKKGVLVFDADGIDGDALIEAAIEANALDVLEEGDTLEVHAEPDDFEAIRDTLAARSFTPASAEVGMVPQTTVKLEGREAESMLKLMEALDELDDVKEVFANFDIPEEAMMQAAS